MSLPPAPGTPPTERELDADLLGKVLASRETAGWLRLIQRQEEMEDYQHLAEGFARDMARAIARQYRDR